MLPERQWFSADNPVSVGGVTSYLKVCANVYSDLLDADLTGVKWGYEQLQTAGDVLAEYTKGAAQDAVSSWLCQFTGKELYQDDLHNLSEVFTGWLPEFSQGYNFSKWVGGCGVWAFMHITDCRLYPDTERRYQIVTKVMAGPATGLVHRQSFSKAFAERLLNLLGIPYPPYGEDGIDPLNLGNMWFTAWIQSTPKGVHVDKVCATGTLKKYNADIVEKRKGKCAGPARFPAGCTVYCPFGRKHCQLSVHAVDYPLSNCSNIVTPHMGYIMNEGWCSKCLREGRFISKREMYNDPSFRRDHSRKR